MKHKNFNKNQAYTYFIKQKSTGLKYHGVRWANIKRGTSPNEDFAKVYFSSGNLAEKFKDNPNDFEWKICWAFDTILEARKYEVKVNNRIFKRPDWANNASYPIRFHEGQIPWNKGMVGVQAAWNKGLTKETDIRMEKMSNTKMGHGVSHQTRNKISKTLFGLPSLRKVILNIEELKRLYFEKKYTIKKIAKVFNCNVGIVYKNFKDYNIVLENTKYEFNKSMSGENNPMYGKSVYEFWLEKYGKEIADIKMNDANEKRRKTLKLRLSEK